MADDRRCVIVFGMNTIFPLLIGIAMLAVLGILLAGVIVMARGGEANHKYGNLLMRWRVFIQFIAVLLILLYFLVR